MGTLGEMEVSRTNEEAFMSWITLQSLSTAAFVWLLFASPVAWAATNGQNPLPPQEEFLEYRVHRGEALADIARLFRLPVEELAQLNNISDPTRLQIDQPLKVPNVFARQAVQLQEERNQLMAGKEQLEQQLREQQKLLAAKETELRSIEAEKTALAQELASVGQWKRGAQALMVLLLGVVAWGLAVHKERARLAHKLTIIAQENAALTTAKEKYRQAAAHLELRYQKLYGAHEQVSTKFVSEGVALISRSFAEGSVQMEQILANLQAERAKEEQLSLKEQKAMDSLLQPLRGFWHRLKYHGA